MHQGVCTFIPYYIHTILPVYYYKYIYRTENTAEDFFIIFFFLISFFFFFRLCVLGPGDHPLKKKRELYGLFYKPFNWIRNSRELENELFAQRTGFAPLSYPNRQQRERRRKRSTELTEEDRSDDILAACEHKWDDLVQMCTSVRADDRPLLQDVIHMLENIQLQLEKISVVHSKMDVGNESDRKNGNTDPLKSEEAEEEEEEAVVEEAVEEAVEEEEERAESRIRQETVEQQQKQDIYSDVYDNNRSEDTDDHHQQQQQPMTLIDEFSHNDEHNGLDDGGVYRAIYDNDDELESYSRGGSGYQPIYPSTGGNASSGYRAAAVAPSSNHNNHSSSITQTSLLSSSSSLSDCCQGLRAELGKTKQQLATTKQRLITQVQKVQELTYEIQRLHERL